VSGRSAVDLSEDILRGRPYGALQYYTTQEVKVI